jgi:DNA-binding SARP family transcriptional activator/DNA-binding transcriptional ArsR family regulator
MGERRIELRLLGRFVVLRDGLEIPAAEFGGRKVRALVRGLATRRGGFVSHDALTEMLWADRPPADPVANIQVLVNRARRVLGDPDLVRTGSGGYALAGGEACIVDAEQFLVAARRAGEVGGRAGLAEFERAFGYWTGEPLAEDAYADWAAAYRDRLTRARQQALEEGAQLALDLGEPGRAVEFAAAAANAQPLREVAVLTLIRALAAAGDPAAALERYDHYRRALARELGVDPSSDAQHLYAQLLRSPRGASGGRTRPAPGFAPVPFVGRAAELDALAAVAVSPEVFVLSGPSGAGKTGLLEQLATHAPVVMVRAYPAEQDEAWSLARSLVREVLAADATLAEQLPASMGAALAWLLPELELMTDRPAPDPESRSSLLVAAAARLLTSAGAAIVIDDMQWADATSLDLVEAVLPRLVAAGAVLALRPDESRQRIAVTEFLGRVRRHAHQIDLRALSAAEIAELTDDPALADRLARSTDGTPIAIVEVLRALAAAGLVTRGRQPRWRLVAGADEHRVADIAFDGQGRAISSRADAQPVGTRDVLELLALLAREVSARVLAAATGQDERTILERVTALAEAGLARLGERGWTTAHDMIAEVIAQQLPADIRGHRHAMLASALESQGAPAGEVARHWAGASDADRAADAYCRAAEQAVEGFASGEAIVLAESGLALAAPGRTRAALQETRAEARARLGDISGARADLRDALVAHPRGVVRSRLLGRMASLASGSDDLVRAAELAEHALIEAGADPPSRALALEIASVLDMNLDRAARAEQRADEALRVYEQLGDTKGMARVLDGRAMATFLDGAVARGAELLERVANLFEDSGDLLRVITPRSTAGHGRVFAGDPAAGLELTTSALELARTLGHPEGETYALWHRTEALACLGRTQEALAAAEAALDIARRIGHRGWTATAWRALGIARQQAGDLPAALHAFESSLEASEHLNLFASWAAARCALVLIALARLDEAAPLVARAFADGPPLGRYEARLAEVELAVARGDATAAMLAAKALRRADAAGMRQGRARLVELAGEPR